MNNRIDTLQTLRCFAFLGVFLSHLGFSSLHSLGRWGVSVFLVLSGFLMSYNYFNSNKFSDINVKNNIKFVIRKLKNLYPLHIVILLFYIFISWRKETPFNPYKIVLNVLLIQNWFPIPDVAINGVTWYLCTVIFSYFIFPYVNRYMEKKYNKKKAILFIGISIIIQIVIGLIAKEISAFEFSYDILQGGDLLVWLVYLFPMTRIWEFIIGCNLAYIFMHSNYNIDTLKCTLLELFSICLIGISLVIRYIVNNVLLTTYWWSEGFVFIIGTITTIYVFAIGKGKISHFLTNKITDYIAKISSYAYLIHYTAIWYGCEVPFKIFNIDLDYLSTEYGNWERLMVGAVTTVILCEIWIRIIHCLRKMGGQGQCEGEKRRHTLF